MVIHSVTSSQKAQVEGLLPTRPGGATGCPADAMVSARRRLLHLDRQPGTREVHRRYMPGPSHFVTESCAASRRTVLVSRSQARWSWISLRKYVNACPPQEEMLHRDDGDRPQDVAPGDHHWRLINRHPPNFGRLINFRLAD